MGVREDKALLDTVGSAVHSHAPTNPPGTYFYVASSHTLKRHTDFLLAASIDLCDGLKKGHQRLNSFVYLGRT